MTEAKEKNRSQIHEIYGQKENIVMILSDSLVQIQAGMVKRIKTQEMG